MVIIVDTREQDLAIYNWLKSKGKNVIRKKLDYGDYSFYVPKNEELGFDEDTYFDKEIVIERKNSLEELIGNLTVKNGERLEKELRNCPAKMVMIIEDQYDRACLGTYKSGYNRKSLLGKLSTLEHKYNVPIKFLSKPSMPVAIWTHFRYYLRFIIKSLDNE